MSTYARTQSGVVMELFTPPAGVPISQCFAPALTWVECDGTPGVAPGWTATEANGVWTFAAPAAAALSLAQQAQALLASGLTITSTGTPAINGTYPCDSATQDHITAEMTCIQATNQFAGGATTLQWLDISGVAANAKTFPSPAVFQDSLAVPVAAFVAACLKVINGLSTTLPSASVTVP